MANPRLSGADRRILRVLQREGRISNVELARRVGMSPSPCLRRVRRLEQEGVIKSYAAVVDPRAVGLGVEAFAQVNIERHTDADATAFREAVRSVDEVVACYVMTGEMDFLLRILVPDLDAYGDFIRRKLLKMPSVKDVRTSFAIEVIKNRPGLPMPVAQPVPVLRMFAS